MPGLEHGPPRALSVLGCAPIDLAVWRFTHGCNKNNVTDGPKSEQFFGITMYNPDQNHFRNGQQLFVLPTGPTRWAGGIMPRYDDPGHHLIPVTRTSGVTLLAELKSIFSQVL